MLSLFGPDEGRQRYRVTAAGQMAQDMPRLDSRASVGRIRQYLRDQEYPHWTWWWPSEAGWGAHSASASRGAGGEHP